MSERKPKRAKKVAATLGVIGLGLGGLYLYQPQRIDFFPTPAPEPNPLVDPDQERLFSKDVRIAVISAHPDDTEFYIGGTLTELYDHGAKILVICCTDGDKGYYPWFLTNAAENRRVRRQEQIDAAKTYGADVVFLARPDGRLHADASVVEAIHQKLLDFKPEYVLAFDPIYPPKIQHSDHLQSGVAAGQAAQGVPSVKWLLRYSTHAANFIVDVTAEWATKMAILKIHKSQFHGFKVGQLEKMLRYRAQSDGTRIGAELAEGFRVEKPTG